MPTHDAHTMDPNLWRAQAYADFCVAAYELIRRVPQGHVCTYGRIAAAIPAPQGMEPLAYRRIRARWVGYALKKCPHDVPWWRIVNARGEIARRPGHGPHLQRIYLQEEGVQINNSGQVALEHHLWEP